MKVTQTREVAGQVVRYGEIQDIFEGGVNKIESHIGMSRRGW